MANASIFQQYLQAPQSVTSKIAALDQADFQRAQMEGAVRQNRLQELAFQRGEQERAAAQAEASLLQRLAAESGGDETKYAEGLRKVGKFTQAGEIEKARGARLKENTETLDKRLGIYKSAADNIQDRNQALGWLQAQFNDPIVGPLIQSRGTFEDLARNIPDNAADPQGFAQWRMATSQGMSKVQEMYAPKPTTIDLGGRKVVIDQNPNSPTFGKELQGFQVSNPAQDTLIFDPKTGKYVVNEPLVSAKARIAQAGAPVTMGSPIAAELPSGQQVFVQPANRPGAAPQVLRVPNTGETLAPPTKQTAASMSPTLQKELIETDDTVSASRNVQTALQQALKLNKTAYSGFGADVRAKIRSNLPGESEGANATVEMNNIILGQALESLKATFGGAPTEGERKILIDLQASADKTPAQREALLNRAIQAAQRRENSAKAKAEAIRSGRYLTEGVRAPAQPQDQPKAAAPSVSNW